MAGAVGIEPIRVGFGDRWDCLAPLIFDTYMAGVVGIEPNGIGFGDRRDSLPL